MATTTEPAEQGTHFWFMSIQAAGSGVRPSISAFSGTLTPEPGETRYDLYCRILDSMKAQHLPGLDCAAVAFDIQPNKL